MPKTVLITGASSGIGRATAEVFQRQGWNVIATMRSPEATTELSHHPNVWCRYLDVTQPESIQAVVTEAMAEFAQLDVLINNAGYGLMGAFENCTPEQIQKQFDTNVFGLMNVTRAVLPQMRSQRSGLIINVSSIGGQIALPLYSLYHASKWAVEGLSDALQYELEPFNIRVKLVEPGPIKTDFYDRSADLAPPDGIPDYQDFVRRVMPKLNQAGTTGSPPEVTAQIIYQAATDNSKRLRYPAGGNAGLILGLRKVLPDWAFSAFVRRVIIQ